MRVVIVGLFLLLEVPVAIVSTLLAVRLLGTRRSWVAITTAGLIGWVSGNVLQLALHGWDWDAARLSIATVAYSVGFTMLAAVGLDLLARPGTLAHGEGAGLLVLPSPIRDLRRRLAPYARYRQVIRIARDNGLPVPGPRRRRRPGDRVPVEVALRTTLEQCGVVFVKLGQMASTRDDLLSYQLRHELSKLQSSVEPLPRELMQPQLEADLDVSVEDVFAEFDWEPIGSASIAQAYAAQLRTGEPVVVKVQRPGIDEVVARDTTALLHLARAVERRTPQGRQLHVSEIAEQFAQSLRRELDFPREAANAIDLAEATAEGSGVRIPYIYTELSSPRVLVQERFEGTTVADRRRVAELGLAEEELADRLVETMATHMLSHGHFHADPHPGNVLLLDDGTLGLIDFGATGRLDPRQRTALLEMTMAAMRGDSAGLVDAVEQVGIIGRDGTDAALERALARFLSENVGPGLSFDAKVLSDLIPLLGTFDIRLPGELSVFFRALVLLDGTARTISPGYSLVGGMSRLLDDGMPAAEQRGATVQDQLVQGALAELPRLRRLPGQLDRILSLTARGELRTRVALFSTDEDARVVTTLVNRIVLGLGGALLFLGSSILLMVGDRVGSSVGETLTRSFGYIGLAFAAILLLRVVAAILREGHN